MYVQFAVTEGETLLVKAASSFTDREGALRNLAAEIPHWDFDRTRQSSFTNREGALRNLAAEIPHWDFDRTRQELSDIWERHLASIQVKTGDETARRR